MMDPLAYDPRTFAEAARLNPDEQPGELDAGRWMPVTRNTWRHGRIVVKVCVALDAYSQANPGWSVSGGDPGVKLEHNPDKLRGPDVAMVRVERQPEGSGADGWLEGAPDVAVEVAGDAQSVSEMTRKALEYLAAGAQLVWVLDAEPRRVLIFTPPDHVRVIGSQDTLDGGSVLPGFSCPVARLFE